MLVSRHIGLRFGRGSKGKFSIYGDPKTIGREVCLQILHHQLVNQCHFLSTAGSKGRADIIDSAQRMQVKIEFTLHAPQSPDIDYSAR